MTADGTVMIRNGLPIVRLTSVSDQLIIGMQKLLFNVGIACGYFTETTENSYNGVFSGTYSKHLTIYDIPKYKTDIGFITSRKQSRLDILNPFKIENDIDWSFSTTHNVIKVDTPTLHYVYDLHCEHNHNFFANDILVHNTDSIFVSPVKSIEEGKSLESYLNDELKTWSVENESRVIFSLKFEKLYRRILFKSDSPDGKGVKKKYCGWIIWEEGKDLSDEKELNYKGLELKRSDQANVTRECLRYFLEQVLIEGNVDAAMSHVKKVYNHIVSGKDVNIFDISLPKAVRSVKYHTDNPLVRGIRRAKVDYEYIIREGAKPRLIYLHDDVICIDDEFDVTLIENAIDYKIMADKVIRKKLESYIWSIGYDWNKVVYNQKGLSVWF